MRCLLRTALLSHLGGFRTALRKRWGTWLGNKLMSTMRGIEARVPTKHDVPKFKTAEGQRGSSGKFYQRKTGREIVAEAWNGRESQVQSRQMRSEGGGGRVE